MRKPIVLPILFVITCLIVTWSLLPSSPAYEGYEAHVKAVKKFQRASLLYEKWHPFSSSDVPIDILLPAIERDLPTLPHAIAYARKNVKHPIHEVVIVAPATEKLKRFCEENNCRFVDENSVLPISLKDIDYFPKGEDRRGWLFQQLLKLNADEICGCEHILILDTDTLISRPQTFLLQGRTLFNCSEEHHIPYYKTYRKLLKEKPLSKFSFVSHHMLFEKSKLKMLKSRIESLHHVRWYEAILNLVDKDCPSGFSEYETYGNFCLSCTPHDYVQLHWCNRYFSRKQLDAFLNGEVKMSPQTKSVSFHYYN